jgi:hypothetical protein
MSERTKVFSGRPILYLVSFILYFINPTSLYSNTYDPSLLIDCPLTQIKGKLFHYVFPGPPNYESVEEGDTPDPRWVLKIDEDTYIRLVEMIPMMHEWYQPYIPEDEESSGGGDVIQLAEGEQIGKQFEKLQNKEVVLEGFIGGWPTGYCHTRFMFEVKNILEPKE